MFLGQLDTVKRRVVRKKVTLSDLRESAGERCVGTVRQSSLEDESLKACYSQTNDSRCSVYATLKCFINKSSAIRWLVAQNIAASMHVVVIGFEQLEAVG